MNCYRFLVLGRWRRYVFLEDIVFLVFSWSFCFAVGIGAVIVLRVSWIRLGSGVKFFGVG